MIDVIETTAALLTFIFMVTIALVSIKYTEVYETNNVIMGRALYCQNDFCPAHGYYTGTMYETDNESGCYCYNDTLSEDFPLWEPIGI